MPQDDPIKHVVVLMMENHSFDQILGWMKSLYPKLEGVDANNPKFNPNFPDTAAGVTQSATNETALSLDPRHDLLDVLTQVENGCGGFVTNFARAYPSSNAAQRSQVMAYYSKGFLPVIHTLAENFMVCDRWFSSLPGPTWPNRFFVHTGTSKGHVKMPSGLYIKNEYLYDQNTIFDELARKNITWSIYHHGMCHTLLCVRLLDKVEQFHRIENFFTDVAGPEGKFPQYVFIEPSYGGDDQNDQHPPTDIRKGELLIAQVYNALLSNQALWNSTLFVLLYDEHGGFYDHMVPPPAVPPDNDVSEYAFNQYGVRVPAILISPWVEKNFTDTIFDHTSLLKYLIDKWGLWPDQLGKRVEQAATFAPLLQTLKSPRTDAPPAFDLKTLLQPQHVVPSGTNENQDALVSFSHFLEQKMANAEELAAAGYRSLKSLGGPLAQLEVAKDRFILFLHHASKGHL
ncbi:MAG: alkaline phosphatase family protein [Candidatus Acidiferrales bacterium]